MKILRPLLAALISPALPLLTQTQSTSLRGVVLDSAGRTVPAVRATLTSLSQQRTWNTATNESGVYSFVQIPPGEYDLAVEANGFKRIERRGLTLQVAQTVEIDLSLDIGAVTETVSVTSQAPLLESGTSTLSEVVNARSAESLPLNGRNILQLVQLVPGVNSTPTLRSSLIAMGVSDSVGFNINGGRNLANLILLDGSPQEVPAFNAVAFVPTPDAVQEFNILTNTLSAECGRTSGGVVNMVHRSGTSDFHGTVYEFLRNEKLDANDFFANRAGRPRAPFRYNQFGFTTGGPLTTSRKDTFFFFNYEGVRQVNPGSTTLTVPTPRMLRGDFSEVSTLIYDPLTINADGARQQFPNNVIPMARLNSVAQKLTSFYPAPNRPGIANNFFSQVGSRPSTNLYS
jgi:hypothetical protein